MAGVHYLTLTRKVVLSPTDTVEPGDYILNDTFAAQLLARANGGTMRPLEERRPFDETKDWNGKRLLFIRPAGFGDLVLLTPVLREIKRRWPSVVINVCAVSLYGPVLKNLPFVDGILAFPVTKAICETYDAWVFFENSIEENPRAREVHMTDLFAEITGINGIDDKKPAYALTPSEMVYSMEAFPRVNGTRRLCIQVGASAKARVYPKQMLGEVVGKMLEKGWEVFLLGQAGEVRVEAKHPALRVLSEQGISFRQSAAVLNYADCFLGSDSALLHVAGALGVPAVGLYGPFPANLRTAYCPTTFIIEGKGPCAPCFHHYVPPFHDWPENGPCNQTGRCEVLASIKPDRVIHAIEKQARSFELRVVA